MPVDLHFICRHGLKHKHLGNQRHETGDWAVGDETANSAARVYLHETQKSKAWHGGRIISWRRASAEGRKIFTYEVDGDFRIRCPGPWGQEKAIVNRL
jgi:hypothetical protein